MAVTESTKGDARYVTGATPDDQRTDMDSTPWRDEQGRDRYQLYRLCECFSCYGRGKVLGVKPRLIRCEECRGEGRILQELSSSQTPEGVGVAIVTHGWEQEWKDCPLGLLDRKEHRWLVLPWERSPRNVSDAARTLARSKQR